MGVDHGRADIGVTEQFLYSPNISSGLKEMRGEAVAKCVRRHPFVDSGFLDGAMQSCLKNTFVHMVSMNGSVVRINRHFGGGKKELPLELICGFGGLACESIGKPDRTETSGKICIMQLPNHLLLCKHICNHGFWQHRHTILCSLAITDNQLPRSNIDVFNSQTQTLIVAQTAAVQNSSKQQISTFEMTKNGRNF